MPYHTVAQGECLSTIAASYGFRDYRTVYNDPANAEFREKRPNPNVIWGSADVLWLPGQTSDALTPIQISGITDAVEISVSGTTCFRRANGDLYCWGLNSFGQIGDGTLTDRPAPTQVQGISGNAAQVGVGGWHSCARTTDGRVLCWGKNTEGNTGDGTNISPRSSPVDTALTNVRQIAVGRQHSCAIRGTGTVLCWGLNDSGEVGDGTTVSRFSPTLVSLPTAAISVAAGTYFTGAVLGDGTLWCWGLNDVGQLGTGDALGHSADPVRVLF